MQAALALQGCCAVLATVLAAEPSLRDGLAARGSRGWDKLRTVMEAALSEADRRQLQPILQQVRLLLQSMRQSHGTRACGCVCARLHRPQPQNVQALACCAHASIQPESPFPLYERLLFPAQS